MKEGFLIAAGLVTVLSAFPYARDILRGTTKPNIVSWITWTLLTAIATFAEFVGREYRTAIYTGIATLTTSAIVILGLKYGYVKYTKFDVVCQLSAIVGIILWQIFNSPTIGVLAAVFIDFIGALPTIRHSWLKPNEETWQTYALSGLGGLLALGSVHSYSVLSILYACYIVVICTLLTGLIIIRRRQILSA